MFAVAKEPQSWKVPPELEALPSLPTIHQAAGALSVYDPTIRRRITDGTLLAYALAREPFGWTKSHC